MKYNFHKSLGRLTKDVSQLLGQLLELKFKLAGYDISAIEWVVLVYLNRSGPMSQSQLAEFSGKDKVYIKRVVDRMIKATLLRRKASKTDKRYNLIYLTTNGKRTFDALEKIAGEVIEITMQGQSEEEIYQCLRMLDIFQHNIEDEIGRLIKSYTKRPN